MGQLSPEACSLKANRMTFTTHSRKNGHVKVSLSLLLFALGAVAQTSRPSVIDSGANLPAQPIGPNDLVAVSVYDAPELTRTVRVGADGAIRLPMLTHTVLAAGLMPADLENAIANALEADEILVNPFVTVTMAEYHSRPIQVAGAVKKPVTFQATGPTSLLEALAMAEGLSENAGSEILVSAAQSGPTGTKTILTRRIPVQSLIDAADSDFNVTLTGGEEVRVPEAGRIFVVGNVKKPGAFPLKSGAESSVLQALAYSEGLSPYPTKQAFIYRREGGGANNEIPIALEDIMRRKVPDVPLMANDILYVPENSKRRLEMSAVEKILGVGTGAAVIGLGYGMKLP
jgi:polysaccharide biosynthesis/export protein